MSANSTPLSGRYVSRYLRECLFDRCSHSQYKSALSLPLRFRDLQLELLRLPRCLSREVLLDDVELEQVFQCCTNVTLYHDSVANNVNHILRLVARRAVRLIHLVRRNLWLKFERAAGGDWGEPLTHLVGAMGEMDSLEQHVGEQVIVGSYVLHPDELIRLARRRMEKTGSWHCLPAEWGHDGTSNAEV